ncbi:proline iminopeptidase-family hydrolase [Novosphingobium sp. PASSN1]|uniref:proline iminopeptidase-family hydrolase n=1 Tax=Novosphingobium sp. PASSN1 TaxID=2015561 RepID=UPI0025E95409|nr:proline iminopeptidase-family hydrolase [Novosphingobium sp. PASSN1]
MSPSCPAFTRRHLLGAGLAALAAPALSPRAAPLPELRLKPDRELMVPVEGGRIYVRVNGDLSGPCLPLVYLHGGPGSGHAGLLPLTALADERAVILYDQLDSGRSDAPGDPRNWRVERFVDEIEAVRRALGIERWHLGGGSWGGTLALEYGARRPAALAGLIIQSPLVSTRSWIADANALRRRLPGQWQATLAACEGAAPPSLAQCAAADEAYFSRHVWRAPRDPRITAYRAALPAYAGNTVYNGMWGPTEFRATGTLREYDGESLLARLEGRRTLFVAGEHDEARPETVSAFARRVTHALYRTIPGAAHAILSDAPGAYLPVIREWCRRNEGG